MPVTALILGMLVTLMPGSIFAGSARIELGMAPGIVAEADYWPGEAGMPAILLLHGFLQTREFPTVRRLAEALAGEGYSVLTPSLSLGLNRRKQSMACEAVHTHSMDQDMAELRAWAAWLAEHAGKPPVLIGHSSGGAQLAAMLDTNPDIRIERALLVSLSYFGEEQGPERLAALEARAADAMARSDDSVQTYALSYCRNYVTTADRLMSYLDWDKEHLRAALLKIPAPITVIYGDRDDRIDREWLQTLGRAGVGLRAVAGANHFFDLAHEFDLLDEVVLVMAGDNHG